MINDKMIKFPALLTAAPMPAVLKALTIRAVLISFFGLVLTACAKDPVEIGPANGNKLHVAFTIPDQVPGSYATVGALPSECKFDEAYVIIYDAAGKFVAYTSSNVPSGSTTGSFEVDKPSQVKFDQPYKMLVVANLKYYLDEGYSGTDDYIEANKRLNYNAMRIEMKAVSSNRISRNLPMYAQAEMTLTETSTAVSIVFERAVARIDLVSLEKNLDIEWVKVCNYNNAGYIYHNDYNVLDCNVINGAGSGDVETNPKRVNLTRRKDMADPTAPQSNTAGGLYAFPNINLNIGVNDMKTTCLLFKGTYSYTDKDGNPQTKEGYYRVNACMPDKPQNIKRNNIYRITVKSVSDGGADDEEGAIKSPTVNVSYEINDWTVDNSQEIVTDTEGNYLAVSPASAYIGGSTGSSMTGSIRVKGDLSWSIEKTVPANDWFSAAATSDGTGFILKALTDNTSGAPRSSSVRIKVPGTTLQYDIPVYQYTLSGSQDVVLIVDRRMGDFPLTVGGTGETVTLSVTLGSTSARASISWLSGDKSMIKSTTPALGTPGITDNSAATLVFRSNLTGMARSAVYKVTRTDGVNPDISLNITFTQPAAAQVIVPTPSKIFDDNTVDGFMNLTGAANSKKCKFQRVYVTMLDLDSYPKWQATSSFHRYDVALVAKPTADTDTYPPIGVLVTTAAGASGECFDIAVARCGPGDAPLTGTITIEGCDAAGKVVPDGARYTIPLKVYSSLQSGFTQVGNAAGTSNIIYHDRNIGAPESNIGDEAKITIPALPFSNYSDDYQSADKNGVTYSNFLFKGAFYSHSATNTPPNAQCPEGWRVPTRDEWGYLVTQMQWAKAGYWPYVVANKGEYTGIKGCYFPLSGKDDNGTLINGYYWTNIGYHMYVTPSSATVTYVFNFTGRNSIRCVRDL